MSLNEILSGKGISFYELSSRIVEAQGKRIFTEEKSIGSLSEHIADMEVCLERVAIYFGELKEESTGYLELSDSRAGKKKIHGAVRYIKKNGLDWFGSHEVYKSVDRDLNKPGLISTIIFGSKSLSSKETDDLIIKAGEQFMDNGSI